MATDRAEATNNLPTPESTNPTLLSLMTRAALLIKKSPTPNPDYDYICTESSQDPQSIRITADNGKRRLDQDPPYFNEVRFEKVPLEVGNKTIRSNVVLKFRPGSIVMLPGEFQEHSVSHQQIIQELESILNRLETQASINPKPSWRKMAISFFR